MAGRVKKYKVAFGNIAAGTTDSDPAYQDTAGTALTVSYIPIDKARQISCQLSAERITASSVALDVDLNAHFSGDTEISTSKNLTLPDGTAVTAQKTTMLVTPGAQQLTFTADNNHASDIAKNVIAYVTVTHI